MVESELGEGSSFSVYFPRTQAGERAKPQPDEILVEGRANETILLVEDDEGVRVVAARILRDHGYEVLEARRASEARRLWATHGSTIDLLLADVVMPDTNGPRLAEELLEARPGLRVLFMSGYPGSIGFDNLQGVAGACIEKPFTPASLAAKVREVLGRVAVSTQSS